MSTPEPLPSLSDVWRRRADALDRYAERCRRDGDSREAEEAEQAAVDYRQAADELDLGAA
jgi:hypothetical protein